MEILKFIAIAILMIYLIGCVIILVGVGLGKMSFRFTDGKEHTIWQYIVGFIVIVLLWPFCLTIEKRGD